MNLQSFTLLQIELRRTLVYTYCRTVQWALRIVLQARSAGRDTLRRVVPLTVSRSVRCTCCDITLNSPQQAQQHYIAKAHQRCLQKLQQPRPPDTETETESRDEQPERDAERGSTTAVSDYVTRKQVDVDAHSITTQDDEGV